MCGDAVRVPGSYSTLAGARARGGDVRTVYSAMDALEIAGSEPDRQLVLLGRGFEIPSPTVTHAMRSTRAKNIQNFSVLSAHKAIMPAMEALLRSREVNIGESLCPGRASMILSAKACRLLSEQYGIPCVVVGFEPNDVLLGVIQVLRQVETGLSGVENDAYPRAVAEEGNPAALRVPGEVCGRVNAEWRGLGSSRRRGYEPKVEYEALDARRRFLAGARYEVREPSGCRCADVLRGRTSSEDCGLFGNRCTPDSPVGASMVSSEGACGAHHRYRRRVDLALRLLRRHPIGRRASRIGSVVGGRPRVVARTPLGGRRLVDPPSGELLPRIC